MRGKGGKNRPKAGLITGCDFRACDTCGNRVFVPKASDWKTCRPCRRKEKA